MRTEKSLRKLAQQCQVNHAHYLRCKATLIGAIIERPDMKAHQTAGRLALVAIRREQLELEREINAFAKSL